MYCMSCYQIRSGRRSGNSFCTMWCLFGTRFGTSSGTSSGTRSGTRVGISFGSDLVPNLVPSLVISKMIKIFISADDILLNHTFCGVTGSRSSSGSLYHSLCWSFLRFNADWGISLEGSWHLVGHWRDFVADQRDLMVAGDSCGKSLVLSFDARFG